MQGRKNYQLSLASIKSLEQIFLTYIDYVKNYYQNRYGKKYVYNCSKKEKKK